MTDADEQGDGRRHGGADVIHYLVGDEPQETTQRVLSPREIMSKAGIDPSQNYLVEIVGRERVSFKDKPDAGIEMHDGQRFVTVFCGPVPVS